MITLKENESGQVQISEDVIAVIANTTALDFKGVAAIGNSFADGIAEMLGKKSFSKGVKVEVINDSNIKVSLSLSVRFGYKIPDLIFEVQKKIKSSIEDMTGLCVVQININVTSISFEKEKKTKDSDKEKK